MAKNGAQHTNKKHAKRGAHNKDVVPKQSTKSKKRKKDKDEEVETEPIYKKPVRAPPGTVKSKFVAYLPIFLFPILVYLIICFP